VLRRSILLGLPGLGLGALLAFIVVAWLKGDYVTSAVSPTAVSLGIVTGLALLIVAASAGPAHQARRMQAAPILRED
jgi:ABC-type antimicrobial peptide transport system permease subunit